jgi:hypothetical protein
MTIYMYETLSLIARRQGLEEANKIAEQGKIVETETIKYLKIEE